MKWLEVKDATNRCLNGYLALPFDDIVKDLYSNDLSSAMRKVCVLIFIKGEKHCTVDDIEIIREALKDLEKYGYIS